MKILLFGLMLLLCTSIFSSTNTPTGISNEREMILTFDYLDPGYTDKWFGILNPKFSLKVEVFKIGSQHKIAIFNNKKVTVIQFERIAIDEVTDLKGRRVKISMRMINKILNKVRAPQINREDEYEVRGIRFALYRDEIEDNYLAKRSFIFPTEEENCKSCNFLEETQDIIIIDDESSKASHSYASIQFNVEIK